MFGRAERRGNDLARLWLAGSVSELGTTATSVIMPLLAISALRATNSEIGLLTAAATAGWSIFGLPAGVWVDLFPRRSLLVACDIGRAAVLATLPLAYALHHLTLAQLFGVAIIIGCITVFFDIGAQSYVPQIVDRNRLFVANSKLQSGQLAASFVGPGAGGLLVQAVRAPAALLLDVASYIFSAACLTRISDAGRDIAKDPAQLSMTRRVKLGLSFVWHSRTLRPLAFVAACFNFWAVAIGALQVPFLVRELHFSPGVVGLLMIVEAPAALLGTKVARQLTERLGTARAVATAAAAGPACSILMPLAGSGAGVVVFELGAVGLAFWTVISSIVTRVYRQQSTPAELLSRVTAVNKVLSWGVMPLGGLAASALSAVLSLRDALLTLTITAAVSTPLPVLFSPLRSARDLTGAEVPSTS